MPARTWTDEQLREAVKSSLTYTEVVKKLGLRYNSQTHRYIRERILELKLDIVHFDSKIGSVGNNSKRTEDQEKARDLRAKGLSYCEIAKEVGARTGQIHTWVKEVVLTPEAIEAHRISQLEKRALKSEHLREFVNTKVEETEGHHTKKKGDLAVAAIIYALARQGLVACQPLTEHAPFDLIAVSEVGTCYKIQVKYSSEKDQGLNINLASNWSDKNGAHRSFYTENDFDVLAVYCPLPETFCFIPKKIWTQNLSGIRLRFTPPDNGNSCYLVSDFLDFPS